jgi:hypothetical protein
MSVETMTFYECVNPRCPVKWWPVTAGDRCPNPQCGHSGPILGTLSKDLAAEKEADESHSHPEA